MIDICRHETQINWYVLRHNVTCYLRNFVEKKNETMVIIRKCRPSLNGNLNIEFTELRKYLRQDNFRHKLCMTLSMDFSLSKCIFGKTKHMDICICCFTIKMKYTLKFQQITY